MSELARPDRRTRFSSASRPNLARTSGSPRTCWPARRRSSSSRSSLRTSISAPSTPLGLRGRSTSRRRQRSGRSLRRDPRSRRALVWLALADHRADDLRRGAARARRARCSSSRRRAPDRRMGDTGLRADRRCICERLRRLDGAAVVFVLGLAFWLETTLAISIRFRNAPMGTTSPAGASGDRDRTAPDIHDPLSLVRPELQARRSSRPRSARSPSSPGSSSTFCRRWFLLRWQDWPVQWPLYALVVTAWLYFLGGRASATPGGRRSAGAGLRSTVGS